MKPASILIMIVGLMAITSPAYGCGMYGFHAQWEQEPNPWGPLIGFAVILFGFMFAGRSLPRISQGLIIGLLFALASVLGVFSFSVLFFPGAFIAKIVIIAMTIFTALSLFGFRTRRELLGLAKYSLGIFIGLVVYLPMSNFIPIVKDHPTFEWVSTLPVMTGPKTNPSSQSNSKRPVFALSTQNISEQARQGVQNKVTKIPKEQNETPLDVE